MIPSDAWSGVHVLVDDDPRWSADPVEQARAACEGGAPVIQLRSKHATDSKIIEWGAAIRELCRASGARFVVNDRFDLALLCAADGVHVGQGDLPPDQIPSAARAQLAVGRSTHTLEQARLARREGVDYVAIGPVYGTTSKESAYGSRGTALVAEVARAVSPLPLVAIGGIRPGRIEELRRAGAAGAAVISAVAGADDPARATRELVECFGSAA